MRVEIRDAGHGGTFNIVAAEIGEYNGVKIGGC